MGAMLLLMKSEYFAAVTVALIATILSARFSYLWPSKSDRRKKLVTKALMVEGTVETTVTVETTAKMTGKM
jgi:hypothetical protein